MAFDGEEKVVTKRNIFNDFGINPDRIISIGYMVRGVNHWPQHNLALDQAKAALLTFQQCKIKRRLRVKKYNLILTVTEKWGEFGSTTIKIAISDDLKYLLSPRNSTMISCYKARGLPTLIYLMNYHLNYGYK